jgi:hypothetical protein
MSHSSALDTLRIIYKSFIGRPEGKRLFGRTRTGWEENTKLDHMVIVYKYVFLLNLAQNRVSWRVILKKIP